MPTNRTSDAAARGKGRPRAFDRGLALHRALEVFWQQGYAPASVASLCKAMKINPPSLYATFGNKATLFLEALRHYEQTYWEAPAQRFLTAPDIYAAVEYAMERHMPSPVDSLETVFDADWEARALVEAYFGR